MSDVLEVGDVMRWSLELIESMQATPDGLVLMRVAKIERQADHTVKLWLETATADPGVIQ